MQKLIIILTFSLLLFSIEILSADEDEEKNVQNRDEKEASLTAILQDYYSLVRRSTKVQWKAFKYLINQLQKNLFPPPLDFRSKDDPDSRGNDEGYSSAGEKITKAAGKSFQTSKVAVEESAKTAAKAAGEAAHMTADKVKKGSGKSSSDDSHDEL